MPNRLDQDRMLIYAYMCSSSANNLNILEPEKVHSLEYRLLTVASECLVRFISHITELADGEAA